MLFNAGTWPTKIDDPAEARDRYHRVALFEARMNAEHEPHRTAGSERPSLVGRFLAALGLARSAPDTIACSAC